MDDKTKHTAKRVVKTTSDGDRKQVISAYESGFKPSVIGHMLNIKTPTVYGIIKRYKESWQIEAKKRGGNRAKLFSKEAVDSIRAWVDEDNTITLSELAEKVSIKYGVQASLSTIAKEVKYHRFLRDIEGEHQVGKEVSQICRFCLNREEKTLVPIAKILDSYLTIENVERFTGVSIQTNNLIIYAVCPDCTTTLQNSVRFRFSCIKNDAYLREQLSLNKTRPSTPSIAVNAYDDRDPLEIDTAYTVFEIYEPFATVPNSNSPTTLDTKNTPHLVKVKEELNTSNNIEPDTMQNSDSQSSLDARNTLMDVKEELNYANSMESSPVENFNGQPISYERNTFRQENVEEVVCSANYIEPGEATHSDNEKYESDENLTNVRHSERKTRVYKNEGSVYTYTNCQRPVLCNMCGKFVKNLIKHVATHTQEVKHACPHCLGKMTRGANLLGHIKAVHLKLVKKAWKLCGKGCTSNNSFFSHMRSHHGIDKMYECEICSKTYSHPSALRRVHYKCIHSSECHNCVTCSKRCNTREMRPHVCHECLKRFKSRSSLATHQMTHSGHTSNDESGE